MRALSSVFCRRKELGIRGGERDEWTEVAESVWLRFTGGWAPNGDPGSRHVRAQRTAQEKPPLWILTQQELLIMCIRDVCLSA